MSKFKKKAAAFAAITTIGVFGFAGIAFGHNVTTTGGVCLSPTSAGFYFNATQMGDGDRTITVSGNGSSGSITTNTNGIKTVTLTNITPQTGNATFTWTTTAVAPNGTPPIVVDFSTCQPPVDVCPNINGNQSEIPDGMYVDEDGNCTPPEESEASATFSLECVASHPLLTAHVEVSGPDPAPEQFLSLVTTSGSLDPDVQDIGWASQSYSVLQADAFGAEVGSELTASLVLGTDTVSSHTFTVPDCSPVTNPPTTPPTTPPTAPPTTPPAAPTPPTTAPVITAPPMTTPPTAPVTTVKQALPTTGSNDGIYALFAFGLLLVGSGLVLVTRRRPQSID